MNSHPATPAQRHAAASRTPAAATTTQQYQVHAARDYALLNAASGTMMDMHRTYGAGSGAASGTASAAALLSSPGNRNPYPGPGPMPFTPQPLQQSLHLGPLANAPMGSVLFPPAAAAAGPSAQHTTTATLRSHAAPSFIFDHSHDESFERPAAVSAMQQQQHHVYATAMTKLRAQLESSQRLLAATTAELDTVRRNAASRDRESAAALAGEIATCVEAVRAALVAEHAGDAARVREHFESVAQQLLARATAAEADADAMRARTATLQARAAEAQAASARDRDSADAVQRRCEAEMASLRELRDQEAAALRHELQLVRAGADARTAAATQQVASLQADVKRLHGELEDARVRESRVLADREDEARRVREERDSAAREAEANAKRLADRGRVAEQAEREATDRALRAERLLTDERSRRDRLAEQFAALEAREQEAARALARREAETARLESRVEALTIRANTFATEASAVRHEFEVRDSRDRLEEKFAYEGRIAAYRERTQTSRFIAVGGRSASRRDDEDESDTRNDGGDGGGGGGRQRESIVARDSASNNNNSHSHSHHQSGNLVTTPGKGAPPHRRGGGATSVDSSASSHVEQQQQQRNVGVSNAVFREALDSTASEIRDLRRALSLVPASELSWRGRPIEARIESCLDEVKRLNERVARSEAAAVRQHQHQSQSTVSHVGVGGRRAGASSDMTAPSRHAHFGASERQHSRDNDSSDYYGAADRHQQQQQQQGGGPATPAAAMSPAMKGVEAVRNELRAGQRFCA